MDWSTRTVTIGYFVAGAVSLALGALLLRSLSGHSGRVAVRRFGALCGAILLAGLIWLAQESMPGAPSTFTLWLAHLASFSIGLLVVWWLTMREGLRFGRWQDYAWGGAIGEVLLVLYGVLDGMISGLPPTAGQVGFSIGTGAVRGLVFGGLLGVTIKAVVFAVRGPRPGMEGGGPSTG